MPVILFEDSEVSRLAPISTSRPAYGITCGGYRLIDWLVTLDRPLLGVVRRHLVDIQRLDYPQIDAQTPAGDKQVMLVNARLVPSKGLCETLRQWLAAGTAGVVLHNEAIAAALLPVSGPPLASELTAESFENYLQRAGVGRLDRLDYDLPLLERPHEVVARHMEIFPENLNHRLTEERFSEVADGVFAAEGATLGQYVVSDTRQGPILLDQGATVGPYSFLSGPIWLGQGARVLEHASIKDGVCLGHTTKVGGEIEATIVEPFTNKQHHGFLGHSYLGSWINLGAGTCNSDLKNTYGEVKMEYGGEKVSTGMQFLGSIFGDYSKTAINTGIFTGKTLGVCSMIYGFVTGNVPSFTNYARSFGQITEMPSEVMVSTQERMFMRRNHPQRPCDIQLLHDMFHLTRRERQMVGEPLSL